MSSRTTIFVHLSLLLLYILAQTTASATNDYVSSVRLQGDSELGYYYVTLFFGTPAQKQTLIVDTGSVITTIPCTECGDNCGTHHFDGPFKHDNSSSFASFQCEDTFGNYVCNDCTSQPCGFNIGYVEGSSYNGHFTRDFVTFGDEIEDYYAAAKASRTAAAMSDKTIDHDVSAEAEKKLGERKEYVDSLIEKKKLFMPFGCTDRETKLFYEQGADGILGLGVNTNTRSNPPNIVDALHMTHSSAGKAFSICYAQNGGYMTFGGYNSEHHAKQDPHYVHYSSEYNQYRVHLSDISMDGKSLGVTKDALNHGEGAFFDSGTTLTHVPTATYQAITSNLFSHCEASNTHCGGNDKVTSKLCWNHHSESTVEDFINSFPTFTFSFGQNGKAQYEWKPEDYMYKKDGHNQYCMGLSRYDRETILGGTFMKNHDILFDKENSRIGFVRSDCSALVAPTEFQPKEDGPEAEEKEPTKGQEPVKDQEKNTEPVAQDDKEKNTVPTQSDKIEGIEEYKVDSRGTVLGYIIMILIVLTGVNLIVYLFKRFKTVRRYANMKGDVEMAKPRSTRDQENSFQMPGSARTDNIQTDNEKSKSDIVVQSVVEI